MKKYFSVLFAFLFTFSTNLLAETVSIGENWNDFFGTSYGGSINVKQNEFTLSGEKDGITIYVNNGTSANAYVKTDEFRVYNDYTVIISCQDGSIIESITKNFINFNKNT